MITLLFDEHEGKNPVSAELNQEANVTEWILPAVISAVILGGAAWSMKAYRQADDRVDWARDRSDANYPAFRWIQHVVRGVVAISALLALWMPEAKIGLFLAFPTQAWMIGGSALALIGLTISSWALHALGAEYSPCYDSRKPNRVITTGPYRYLRHPVYVGNTLALIGLFIVGPSVWAALMISLVFVYYVRAAQGETKDLQHVGRMGSPDIGKTD